MRRVGRPWRLQETKKKGGPPKWPPILQRQVSGLELVPDADANADRHLELRRVAPEDRADRLAEVRIRRSVGQLRVLVVIEHAALVEEVEDVREQRRSTPTDCPERVGRLQIHLALERRPLLEAVDRLDAGSARRDGDFTVAAIVRVGSHPCERLAGREVHARADVEPAPGAVRIELDLMRTIERQDAVLVAEEADVARL